MGWLWAGGLLAVLFVGAGVAQENTLPSIPPSLRECYNTSDIVIKDNLLPMTINSMINLIQKIERDPSNNMDVQYMATTILQRFRQDGIEKARGVVAQLENVIPYSPRGLAFNKFKIILTNLVPGNALKFPNQTLNRYERCSLHSMLSESIQFRQRGDEGQVCGRLAKFQRRVSRSLKDQVEVVDVEAIRSKNKRGNIQSTATSKNPKKDIGMVPQNRGFNDNAEIQYAKSDCPDENGVIFTKWGAVSGGNLMAGIAAGCEPMTIQLSDMNLQPFRTVTALDNRWGATLAGDLTEAALYEYSSVLEVGASGGWNSTQVPRWYFLSKNTNVYMTDAEIRGGLDGLILASIMNDVRNKIPNVKLSQILDMYYSQRGILTADTKACKRRELLKTYAPTSMMQDQTMAFSIIFKSLVPLQYTFSDDSAYDRVQTVVGKLNNYIPSMNDLACDTDETRIANGDYMIVVDCSWPFEQIYPALSYLLDNIDINMYNSNFTIINGQDGTIIVNSTSSIVDFHENFNQSSYNTFAKGFDITRAVRVVEDLTRAKMNDERNNQQSYGRSLIALFVPSVVAIDESRKNYAVQRINDVIHVQLPDLRFLVLTPGPKDAFNSIVLDSSRDIFSISQSTEGTLIMQSISPLVSRIKEVHMRISNIKCGSDWSSSGSDRAMTQYVPTQTINYYRLTANYFFDTGTRSVKIKGFGYGILSVCYSRTNAYPRANNSRNGGDATCKQVNTDEYAITFTDWCNGNSYIKDCAPLYLSVEAVQTADVANRYSCADDGCRYPDSLKYTISLDNMGCYSSANQVFINSFVPFICIAVLKIFSFI